MLFEAEYLNFAWGYPHYGWYIDDQGQIYRYRYEERPGAPVGRRGEGDRTRGVKIEKRVGQVDPEVLAVRYRLLEAASRGRYSSRADTGRDMGRFPLTGCLYDTQTGERRDIVLSLEGDASYENLSPSAKVLHGWLVRIGEPNGAKPQLLAGLSLAQSR